MAQQSALLLNPSSKQSEIKITTTVKQQSNKINQKTQGSYNTPKCRSLRSKYHMTGKPAWEVIKKKVERQEMKEKFVEYLHIAEAFVFLIIIVSAMIYQYTDFIKAHTTTWIKEMGLYFLSAILSYILILIFRWPIFMRWNTTKTQNAWTVKDVDPKYLMKGRWNAIKTAVLFGFTVMLVMFFVELSGCNNLIVSTIGTGDTTSGCEIYNEMKIPGLSDFSCTPPSSIPATKLAYLFILCFILFIIFGFCSIFLEHKVFRYLTGFFGMAFLLLFIYYTSTYSGSITTTTASVATTASIATTATTTVPTTTDDTTTATTNEEDTILNLKNNYIGYTLVSAGITYVIIALSAILAIVMIMIFRIHTTNFYSYFAGWDKIKGWKLHVLTFFRFILEAVSVAFVMTWPFMRTVINRNKFFNPQYRWQNDSTARQLFGDVWLKISLFYLFLQLAGNMEWANNGYCRSIDHTNIVKSCAENDPIENFIDKNESKIKLQLYIDKLDLTTHKKPNSCPAYSIISSDIFRS